MNTKKISILMLIVVLAFATVACSALSGLGDLMEDSNSFSSDFESDDMFSEFADDAGLVESHFKNGGLEMTIHQEDVYFWAYPNAEIPKNVVVEIDAQFVSGDPETGAGLICNYDYDTDYGIYFEITFDGFFTVFKNTEAGWEYIEEFTQTDLVNKKDNNNIKAVCNDGSYEFYINDELVADFNETNGLGDEVSIYAYTYFTPESVVRFDNFYAEGLE